MNFEKNGQQRPEKSRQNDKHRGDDRESVDDQKVDDEVKLTALALGEISDPDEINRLKAIIDQDEGQRREFEATAHLASMIRDSVENDLPLAPGSIHDVVVAALENPPVKDSLVSDSLAGAPSSDGPNNGSTKVVPKSSQSWWSANGRVFTYASSLSVLGIVLAMVLYFQDWSGKPENIARYEGNSSASESGDDESRGLGFGKDDTSSYLYKSPSNNAGSESNLATRAKPDNFIENRDAVTDDGLKDEQKDSAKEFNMLRVDKKSVRLADSGGIEKGNADAMKTEIDGKAANSRIRIARNYKSGSKDPSGSAPGGKIQNGENPGRAFSQKNHSRPFSAGNLMPGNKPDSKLPADESKAAGSAGSGASPDSPDLSKNFGGQNSNRGQSRSEKMPTQGRKNSKPPTAGFSSGGGGGGANGGLGGGGFGGGGRNDGDRKDGGRGAKSRGGGVGGRSVDQPDAESFGRKPGSGIGSAGGVSGGRASGGGVRRGGVSGDGTRGMSRPKPTPAANNATNKSTSQSRATDADELQKRSRDSKRSEELRKRIAGQGQGKQKMRSKNLADGSISPSADTGKGLANEQNQSGNSVRRESEAQKFRGDPSKKADVKKAAVDKFGDASFDRSKMDGNKVAGGPEKLKKSKQELKSIKQETLEIKPDFKGKNKADGLGGEGKSVQKALPRRTDPQQENLNRYSIPEYQSDADKKAENENRPSPAPKKSMSGEKREEKFAEPKLGQAKSQLQESIAESDESSKSKRQLRIAEESKEEEEKKRKIQESANEKSETDKQVELKQKLAEEMEDLESIEIQKVDPALENDFIQPIGTDAISTFSIDTDTASYTNVRQMLRSNRLPHPEQVRIEEMINYFDFKYQQPKAKEPFSVKMELASSPWKAGNKILKIGLQARDVSNEERPPSNLVFLVDVSGSMRAGNKLPLLQSGLKKMVGKLREDDYVSIVTYSNQILVPLQPTDGSQKEKIIKAIDGLVAAGGTNGGGGLQKAYELAEKHLLKKGTNRIVLGTDGDFNIGIRNDRELAQLVKKKAASGVFITVCGFGKDNFQDQKMQVMSQNGNGKVYYIDSEAEAQRVFADEISGSLVTIAKNVKLQLLFNPRTVQSYRLIGYENRMLAAQDFDNDKKDAGEMNAGDSVTALYEIVPGDGDFTFPTSAAATKEIDLKYQTIQKEEIKLTKVASTDDVAALRIRYVPPFEEKSKLREFVVKNKEKHFNRASREFQLSTAVAGLGMMLRGSRHRGGLNYDNLREFGQTVLNDRPDSKSGAKDQPQAKPTADDLIQIKKRQSQREEVLELINRAADLYERAGGK